MPTPKHHLFVCTNTRPPGNPKGSCGERGSGELFTKFKARIHARNLHGEVMANSSNCLKPCQWGPNVVVYPEGTWYAGVRLEDVDAILDAIVAGEVVERLVMPPEAEESFPKPDPSRPVGQELAES